MTNEQKYKKYIIKHNEEKEQRKKELQEQKKQFKIWLLKMWKVRMEDKEGKFIKEYKDVFVAEEQTGISKEQILKCMKYQVQSAGGYIFRFSDEYENCRWLDKYEDKKYAKYDN